jgi:hypothetical protein
MVEHPHAPILAPQHANEHETTGEVIQVLRVSIRVQSGATRFDVAVLADSAEQAIGLVREGTLPHQRCPLEVPNQGRGSWPHRTDAGGRFLANRRGGGVREVEEAMW